MDTMLPTAPDAAQPVDVSLQPAAADTASTPTFVGAEQASDQVMGPAVEAAKQLTPEVPAPEIEASLPAPPYPRQEEADGQAEAAADDAWNKGSWAPQPALEKHDNGVPAVLAPNGDELPAKTEDVSAINPPQPEATPAVDAAAPAAAPEATPSAAPKPMDLSEHEVGM